MALYIFDVDNTLVTTISGETFRRGAADWQFLPGRKEKVKALLDSGDQVGIATNQGGVAYGFMTQEQIGMELLRMAFELGISNVQMVKAEYSHPGKNARPEWRYDSPRRKPNPGMLLEIMQLAGVTPEQTTMIGDSEDDYKAAKAAGCHFIWADAFFQKRRPS